MNEKKKIKLTPIKIIIILIVVIILVLINNQMKRKFETMDNKEKISVEKQEQAEPKNENTTVVLTAIGDIMCYNTQYQDAFNAQTNTYDFDYMFDDIKTYLQAGDITVGNLETTFGGVERGYSSYPRFSTPDELATTIKNLGIDLLTTANNHCLDTGYEGLARTIDVLDKVGIPHLGTYKTEEDKNKPTIQNIKGMKIAFLNYTYGTNGISMPKDKPYCVNMINKEQIAQDLQKVKEEEPDIIVAMMHWGVEYETTQNKEQKDLANYLFQNGVDIIIGGHPHVLQPMEKCNITLEDGTEKEGFIIYSLGNFIGDQKQDTTKASIILNISITKHSDDKITIDSAKYVPINTYKNIQAPNKKFRLMDIRKELEAYDKGENPSLGVENYAYLQKQLSTITQIVGNEIE